MSTGEALNLNLDDDAFEAAVADLLVAVKVNETSTSDEADARFKGVAQWANLIDDFVLACKRALRRIYHGQGSPEGAVEAPPSSLYQRTDGTGDEVLYVKRTGTGDTGWSALGSGGDAATLQGATLAEAMQTAIERSDGNPSLYVDLVQVDQTTGLDLVESGGGTIGILRAIRTGTPAEITDSTNTLGSAAALAPRDHAHAHGNRGGGSLHALATSSAHGFMSSTYAGRLDDLGATVLFDEDWTLLSTQAFADGSGAGNTINGRTTTVANAAEMQTFGKVSGTGVRMLTAISNGGASGFDTSSQTAAYFYFPLSQIAGFDPAQGEYIYEVYMPNLVLETNGETVFIGLWGAAAAPWTTSVLRMRLAKIANVAGVRNLRSVAQATPLDGDTAIPTHDVLAIRWNASGFTQVYSGVWGGSWATTTLVAGPMTTTAIAGQSPFNSGDVRIVHGLGTTNDATPTTAVTFGRARLRKAR